MVKHQNNLDKIKAETELENIKNENSLKKQELDKEALVIKARQSVLDTEMLALDNQKRILDMSKRQAEETLDRESKRLDEMMRRMRAEHEEALKQEAQRVKETYENRQHARRDAIDFIKFIPATVIGIGAIAALVIKLKDKKA
jgi:ElaB/YqjD/DUF883 family membrane-anchored ribosome-binding protein